ncbi:ABC transporter permease [candidate division KSB1 bacterium]|nr:ABC transporter permease [candidate division KSB1 bacterium]
MMSFGLRPEGKSEDEEWIAYSIRVDDYDFLGTYGLEMTAGRYFSREFATDETNAVVINESLAKSLGWKNPVGKQLDIKGELEDGIVIGVIKDFHTRSLHHKIEPLIFYFAPRWENVSVRIAGENIPATIQFLQNKWQAFESRYPFEYYFLDQKFTQFYESEQHLMKTFGLFSALAIFIASLGLLGLAAYTAEQRTKEIGVRKVLGATVTSIIMLLSKQFSRLVLFAFIVASPVVYFVMNRWLQDFAFRINVSWWVYALAGGLALVIALLTVSTQAIRAALINPVEALRYE